MRQVLFRGVVAQRKQRAVFFERGEIARIERKLAFRSRSDPREQSEAHGRRRDGRAFQNIRDAVRLELLQGVVGCLEFAFVTVTVSCL